MARNYIHYNMIPNAENISFALGVDRQGKTCIKMFFGDSGQDVALVSPPCVTNWPRVTGDGNFGTMWGPTDVQKAKFTLDLTDSHLANISNDYWSTFAQLLDSIDDKLLDFVYANQLRVLPGRKNLTRDEIKMLQIRSVRARYDKMTGALTGHTVQLSASKYTYGIGGRYARQINVCDMNGLVLPHGNVAPGDIVAATMYVNQVYTGVGGDKFGIHWSFEDVQVICQRSHVANKTEVPFFAQYDFAQPYTEVMPTDYAEQFSEDQIAHAPA